MTTEIALARLHPLRPYVTRSHMHTGPLVIEIATPNFWLIPHLRVYDNRDSSRQLEPSPSLHKPGHVLNVVLQVQIYVPVQCIMLFFPVQ
jgi:hypothetical protein